MQPQKDYTHYYSFRFENLKNHNFYVFDLISFLLKTQPQF